MSFSVGPGAASRRFAVIAAAALVGSLAGAQTVPGYPQDVNAFDPREVRLLPRYCNYTQYFREGVPGGGDATLISRWEAELGPTFHHLHHYCFGLMKTNRAVLLAPDQATRQFYLSDALSEFDYVLTRATENFVLLPEILTKKGDVLMHLRKAPLAVLQFERALELKPDYWPPYARLSDHYSSTGDAGKARQVLEAGLAKVPDAKALRRRLADLDADGPGNIRR